MNMQKTTPANVTMHYRRNKATYNKIEARLSETLETFFNSDTSQQIRMLQKSHSFAVISVQCPVDIHEKAFTQLWKNDTPLENIDEALSSVNYCNNKTDYITHSIRNAHLWANVIDLLEADQIDKAHRYILDTFKGVGPAKAPFTLSMLGFTEKMCIDANVINAMGMDEHVNTVVVDKYEKICSKLRQKMPTLNNTLSPFMWQWCVFDWQREEISEHKPFYKVLDILD